MNQPIIKPAERINLPKVNPTIALVNVFLFSLFAALREEKNMITHHITKNKMLIHPSLLKVWITGMKLKINIKIAATTVVKMS